MNKTQKEAIAARYSPLCEKYNLPAATVPEKPGILIDTVRRNEILAELEEPKAETNILLGDDPIKWFLSYFSDCQKTKLSDFGRETYGTPHLIIIGSKTYSVIPLVHVRQGGGIGSHDDYWEQAHNNWVENKRE
jgi:hypothetical protein